MVDDREPDTAIEECVQSKRLYHHTTYHHISPEERSLIQQQLLEWYDREKRTNMPWRKEYRNDLDREALGQRAYEVWVSEIMLQQTQVATVIDYYNRWMEAFPTIFDLAKADIERVNTLWAGLGYYSRARRLWEGAQKVVKQFDGILPNNAKDLQHHIPGVGRYTAGAVASIVFGQETPVVDGNVIRVIARLRAIGADPKKANVVELFWEIAEGLVSQSRPGDFNQALMELGARVCTPQGPDCGACPIKAQCHAYAQVETHSRLKANGFWKATPTGQKRKRDMEHECKYCLEIQTDLTDDDYAVTRYPAKPEKKKPRDEECAVYILQSNQANNDRYLISKRPETGLLAGLWEFPSLELDALDTTYDQRAAKATEFLKERYGISIPPSKDAAVQRHDLGNVVHLFSHIRKVYHIEWIKMDLDQEAMDMAVAMAVSKSDKDQARWVDLQELKKSPIPTGLKKAIKLMENFEKTSNNGKKSAATKTMRKQASKTSSSGNNADISTFFLKK